MRAAEARMSVSPGSTRSEHRLFPAIYVHQDRTRIRPRTRRKFGRRSWGAFSVILTIWALFSLGASRD